jgi:protein SCO1/2
MRLVFTLLVGSLLFAGACARSREYELRGQVLAVDPVRQELTIKHGDIRGFMPGMTMPFKVKDAKLMEGRAPGDLVTATLVVEDNTAYLSTLLATGHAPLTEAPPPPRPMDVLDPGSPVPDATLTDETGAKRSLSDWRGRVLAVTFTYTRCPLPDFCPRMDVNFAVVQREVLKDPKLQDRVALLSISIDPQFDTPEVLAAHARRAGADARVWRFVTGNPEAITQLAGRFGVSVFREGSDPTGLAHNLRTAVIKPDGTLATILGGNDWTPAALIEAARRAGG